MRRQDTDSGPALHGVTTMLLTVLLTVGILAGVWWAFKSPATSNTPSEAQIIWPTIPATFTPVVVSTATALPTPTLPPASTPITIKQERIAELATMSITLSTVQEMKEEEAQGFNIPLAWLNGRDSVMVEYVSKVKLGIDTSQIKYWPDGASVKVQLPSLKILSVDPDWAKSRVIGSTQRWIKSDSANNQKEAWTKADKQIKEHVSNDSELMQTAEQFTKLQIEKQLRDFGFTEVSFK